MTSLSENWVWLTIAIGGFLLMTRMHGMGMGCGMAGGQSGNSHKHHRDGGMTIDHDSQANLGPAGAIDPVSRHPIPIDSTAVSSAYGGLVYWFESRGNRDAFEQDPGKYLADGPVPGQPAAVQPRSAHRHGGCC